MRIGGSRVGVVSTITPQRHKDGSVTALLTMKLQTNVKPLPKDSTLIVRPRSALGLKYVEITLGQRKGADGKETPSFQDGATIPLANATPQPVEIDEVFNIFDEPTRSGEPDEPARVRQRASPAAGATSTRRSRSSHPLLTQPRAR